MQSPEERAFQTELMRIELIGKQKERKRILKEKRESYKNHIAWPSQSKMGMWYIFVSCSIVQIYSMIAMWHFADLSPLTALIGATVGEGITYYAYTAKAKAENTEGGIVYANSLKETETETNGAQG